MRRQVCVALVALLASSCGGAPASAIPGTSAPDAIPTIVSAAPPKPSPTPPPAAIITEVAVPTPTYDFRTAVTTTPPPQSICPPEKKIPPLDLYPVYEENRSSPALLDPILEYLNSGGDAGLISDQLWEGDAQLRDLTGDGISEIFLTAGDFNVLGCAEGKYQVMYAIPGEPGLPFHVHSVSDMNLDNLPEIVLVKRFCFDAPCYKARILEFDGRSFADLIYNTNPYWARNEPGPEAEVPYGSVSTMDVDLNGTVELLLEHSETPAYVYPECWIPERSSRDVFMWNGAAFVPSNSLIAPPRYRFQAVLHGDYLYSTGEYEDAIGYYHAAITEESLGWWSAERREYLIRLVSQWAPGPTPTPPQPDTTDFSALSAYSGFRTMLAYVAMAQDQQALDAYNSLEAANAPDTAGYPFLQMAHEFWSNYTTGRDIKSACLAAIRLAQLHPDQTLTYFGPERLGCWAYGPQDLCPAPTDGLTTR